ncbi:MAG: 5'-methylthioadenosine/adenosylhomocysteine nucleosidase [Anaerofustis sp.]
MIGVIASMQSEMAFEKECEKKGTERHASFEYERYDYNGIELVCAVCGTGKVSAAVCTQLMIEYFHPSLIINIGTAGSIAKEIHNKDVIIAIDSVQHDFDISPFGWEKGELPELGVISLPCDEGFLQASKQIPSMGYRIHYGRILSGDQVVVDQNVKTKLTDCFGGLCAEMEGAAVGQVCAMNQVAYAIIRGISDGDSEDQQNEFLSNIESVAEINGHVLLASLKEYENTCM